MLDVLDMRDDPFAAVMGARRGLDADADLVRLDVAALIDELNDGNAAPLLRAVAAHRRQAEHPVIRQLAQAGADDLADDLFDIWCSRVLSPVSLSLHALLGNDVGWSPWLAKHELDRSRRNIKRVFHVVDLRPDHAAPPRSAQTLRLLCGSRDKVTQNVTRGSWKAPSRTRANRCAACLSAADELGLVIPALTEPTGRLPDADWTQATRAALAANIRGGLLAGGLPGAHQAGAATARAAAVRLLGDTAAADPLPVIFHLLALADRQHLAVGDPRRLHAQLTALPWHDLLDGLVPHGIADENEHDVRLATVRRAVADAVRSL